MRIVQLMADPHPTTGYPDNRCYRELRSHIWYANFSFVVQQFRQKFKIQKVDKMEEKRQRNSYLSFRVT
jgi:hypothetical protein